MGIGVLVFDLGHHTFEKTHWYQSIDPIPKNLGFICVLLCLSALFNLVLVRSQSDIDVIKRPFITVGFISFVLLIPLALTSNQWAVKKLKRSWARLHQLIYLIAPLVILHYFWHKSGKNDYFTVSIYGAILLILLALRLRPRLKP